MTAIWDLEDGQVDTWLVPPLIPSDVDENGEIVAKPSCIKRSEKSRKKKKKQEDKEDKPGEYVKVKDPEVTSFYLEVKFEIQKDRSPIIRLNMIRPMAADKRDKKRQLHNRTISDMVEKKPQFDLMVEGANHLMLNTDKEEKTTWLQRFEQDNIADLRQKVKALMNEKYPFVRDPQPGAETVVRQRPPKRPKPAAAPKADSAAPAVGQADAADPKAHSAATAVDHAAAAAPKAETDETHKAEKTLKGAEAWHATAKCEAEMCDLTKKMLQICRQEIANLKGQQGAHDLESELAKAEKELRDTDAMHAMAPSGVTHRLRDLACKKVAGILSAINKAQHVADAEDDTLPNDDALELAKKKILRHRSNTLNTASLHN